jgi:hypothetical protein
MIGLHGYSRVGKDTLAELLGRYHDYYRIGFADPLYAMLLTLDPLVPSTLNVERPPISVKMILAKHKGSWRDAKDDKIYGPELVSWLQRLGTDGVRNHLGEDTWIRVAQRKVDQIGGRIVISDVRFPNEAQWVRLCGGLVVRITRPGYGPVNDHVADAGQDQVEVDFTIRNEEAPEDMLRNLEWFLSR